MEKDLERPSYYAIIPSDVRYSSVSGNAKLLYGEITALANRTGTCWASNKYFADLYKTTTNTISRWVAELVEAGFVTTKINKSAGNKRYIRIATDVPIHKNDDTYPQKRLINNNTSNNKKINKKEKDVKSQLEDLISLVNPKEKPTEDRQRLLNARLKEYSFGEIKNAARAFSGSKWHRDNGQMSIDNLLRPSKFGRWYSEGLELEPEADAVEDSIVKAAGDAFPARWPKGKPEWSEDDDENRYFRGVKIDHTNQGEIMKIEEARRGA